MKWSAKFAHLLLIAALPLAVLAQNQKDSQKPKAIREESKIWILRGLSAEYATLRVTLPKGDKGLSLRSDGKIDENELKQRLTDKGMAARKGEVVQITAVDFGKDKIVFAINGGGKQKRNWLSGVQVGMGTSTRPVTNQNTEAPKGSYIELVFDGRVPDITVDDVKQMLAPALDFTRRSPAVIYTETLPKEVQEAIKDHKVTVGMDRDMVLASVGKPGNKIRETKRGVEQEDWIYGIPPAKVTIVTFEGDKVVKVNDYTPGIPETNVPRAEKEPASTVKK